ncbi:ATP-dependent metallopeptidase FtsH/Yme1/Tma family protein [Staphylococcus epidermidis]|uniref:ATP-dependent zinc metalloprotease FtsH n=1 Tax=Staphylococcus epidermidis TaxID=1282 RepID=UPI001E0CD4D4|nr:ATP-dependent zinc metalloprotease FtsH [Staphylococcus epidermidis]MBM6128953.1 ATP-dependent metallopeptidase FtsH/Yme1/Tma family protein [Staphylococcus epidermidis]MBM6135667.1 ATP-dependent metallopeptidase FtsH/Yme1/Tma family protein [Staphylococcus epidermidis]MBM6137902.1 ATP-dependent metallopeptidase FtsH/Yme1/Tma family protein [Staphylococcus epidermidis]MBM6142601.1 ATP-dependent metallopeptidase FtsH/Yme1/Tma family protein [Staphylococcus epidermidis]MBM6144806.1 ATP-depend
MQKAFRNVLVIAIIGVIIFGLFSFLNGNGNMPKQLTYTQFVNKLNKGDLKTLEIQPEQNVYMVSGKTKKDEDYSSTILYNNEKDLQKITDTAKKQDNLKFTVKEEEKQSVFVSILTTLIPVLIIALLFIFFLSQAQGGGGGGRMMNFGKSKAKMYDSNKRRVRFSDVAGADEEKQELIEIVDFLKDNKKFKQMGSRIPKGVLLVGPPGTGKTLLARAVAGEAGAPFFSISGSDFVEMFVGVGASRVRDLFENAKKNAPCIIFIDEIDAVGRQRGAGVGGGHDEREQTLNQLLVEMDGFGENEGIIMIAATNRPDILDPALLRPGRFDRQIQVGRPDVKGREAILHVHAKNKPLDETVDLKAISQRTPGFSGADLENLLNEASLIAAREGKNKIDMRDIEEATDRVIAGPAKKSRVISEKERNIVAHHEAGHTIIGMVLDEAEIVHKVTIVPRGQAGGYAMMLPKQDRFLMTEPELLDKICGLLGGRVSEDINFGEVSTGASNDFERATQIARSMVTEYGMSKKLGPLQFSSNSGGQVFLGKDMQGEPNYSGQIAYEIDKEVQRIVKEQYERCKQILLEHEEQLKLIAKTLLSEETLVAEQIQSLFYDGVLPEVDYDSAKVVKNENSDYSDGKYGKSYNDIRKEQLEDDDKEDDDNHEKDEVNQDNTDREADNTSHTNEPGHQQSPNIDKPYNPNDSNHRQ